MNSNYFTIHNNKKTKKVKEAKPYTKLQIKKMEECTQYFLSEIERMKHKLFTM